MFFGDPWDRRALIFKRLSFGSDVATLASCSFEYLMVFDWARHQGVCRHFHCTVGLAWSWFRHQPLSLILAPGYDRCTVCGWLSGNRVRFWEISRCYECDNVSVCEACVYYVPSLGSRCLDCDALPDFMPPHLVVLHEFLDVVCQKHDVWFGCISALPLACRPAVVRSFAALRRRAATSRRVRGAWKLLVQRAVALDLVIRWLPLAS